MNNRLNLVFYSLAISIVINVIAILAYSSYTYNTYFQDANNVFQSRVSELDSRFDNYNYIVNSIKGLWELNIPLHIDATNNKSKEFLHLSLADKTAQGKQIHAFANSLDISIIKKLNDQKVRLFLRSFESQELISLQDFSHEQMLNIFDVSRCNELMSCNTTSDTLRYSNLHHTLIDDQLSLMIISHLKGTSFNLVLHLSLEDINAFTMGIDKQKIEFYNQPFKLIKLLSSDYTEVLDPNSDVVFFHPSKFGYLITERHPLFAPIHTLRPLMIASFLFLPLMIYMLLNLKLQNTLIQKTTTRSVTDNLTGAYNRDFIDLVLLKENTLNNGGTILYLDGNKVKAINDQYGHNYGDIAIQLICDVIASCIRSNDYLIRVGGDEFVVVLTGCDEKKALKIYETITDSLALKSASKLPFVKGGISVSFGICTYNNKVDFDSAITKADLSMLQQKEESKAGR